MEYHSLQTLTSRSLSEEEQLSSIWIWSSVGRRFIVSLIVSGRLRCFNRFVGSLPSICCALFAIIRRCAVEYLCI